MQMKHLIIFTLVGMVILLGFNMINGSRHEQNRAAAVNNNTPVQSTDAAVNEPAVNEPSTNPNQSADITSKPLGEQPKAIIDNVTTQIDQAQLADQKRLEQLSSAQ